MKNIQIYVLYGLILLGCFSCKKEDDIKPNAPLLNPFAPAEGVNDPTSKLRQQFYNETGCYLLFTDTLKNEYAGTDVYGNSLYNTELLDLTYGINSSVRRKFAFTNLTGYEEQKAAVELLKEQVLPALDKKFYPYSFLLIDKFKAYTWWVEEGATDGSWDSGSEQDFYIGVRAMAISISMLQENKEEFVQKIIKKLITDYLTSDKLREFYAPGKNYYGQYFMDGEFESEEEFVMTTGILAYYYDEYDYYLEVYGMQSDLDKYLTAILERSEEEFETEYDGYDLVIKKYNILKQLLIDGGFNLN